MKTLKFPLVLTTIILIFIVQNLAARKTVIKECNDITLEKVKTAMLCMQRYSWEQGVAMQALLEIGDSSNLLIMARESVQRSKPDGRLSMVGSDFNIGDTGVNGAGVLAAYKITGDEKYKKAAQGQYDYLKKADSKNIKGVIYHNNKGREIFSDNMFMVAPFMAQMGDYDEALHQVEGIRTLLWNRDKKLFHHIKTEETGNYGDPSFWGGGNGWCAAAMAQIINILPAERMAEKQKLIGYCTEVLDGCIANQLQSGLFYDKITEPNFEESTLAAMLAYTIYTGIKAGWLNSSYLVTANEMRAGVYSKVDKYGLLQGASAAPTFNSPGTSPEGQAFFLMMEGSFRKLKK